MSRVALLVPAYNAARTIGRLFDSAAGAGGFDEMLVYDDASTDDTADVCRRAGAVVLRGEINAGPSVGKNHLTALTRCDWLHFHDADDALRPDFLVRARKWMAQPDVDAVIFGTEDRDDATGACLGRAEWDDASVSSDPVRYHLTHTVTNCGLYRRSVFLAAGGFETDPATAYNEDQAMHLRLALAGARFRADPGVGVIIYRRAASMSSSQPVACARAQVEVLARAARQVGARYPEEIGARLWRLAGVAGGLQDWETVDRCMALASALGYGDPRNEHWLMRAMARFDPATAVRAREWFIRMVKPGLRQQTPRAARADLRGAR